MRVAFYLRVSKDEQTIQNQLGELRRVAELKGWEVIHIFKDEGISGAKNRESRPGYDALLKLVEANHIDMVAAWSIDRLSRSIIDLADLVQVLDNRKINLYLHMQQIDTATPTGKLMFHILGALAEFERSMISERTKAGLKRVVEEGRKLGRKSNTDPTAKHYRPNFEKTVIDLRKQGWTAWNIRDHLRCRINTVYDIIRKHELGLQN